MGRIPPPPAPPLEIAGLAVPLTVDVVDLGTGDAIAVAWTGNDTIYLVAIRDRPGAPAWYADTAIASALT